MEFVQMWRAEAGKTCIGSWRRWEQKVTVLNHRIPGKEVKREGSGELIQYFGPFWITGYKFSVGSGQYKLCRALDFYFVLPPWI